MENLAQVKFGIGAPLRRKEDAALLVGAGRFTDDVSLPDQLYGHVLRSPHAHARITALDVSAARAAEGVHLVLTGADVEHLAPLTCQYAPRQADGSAIIHRDIPVLCADIVRYAGDAVAFIVAESAALARDAAELVVVDYESLPANADTATALAESAPLVYPQAGTNLAFYGEVGEREPVEAAFRDAAHVSEIRLINNRLVSNYLEPRACLSQWLAEEGRWEVFLPSQGVHGVRRALSQVFAVAPEKIRVRTGDVGGAFGVKAHNYREYPLVMEAARRLGRPVKWTADRSEHFIADAHGRDNIAVARMAMDENGRFLALHVELTTAMGAYLHGYAPFIPMGGSTMATGIYHIPAMLSEVRGVYTNTTPTDAYRGAGRPEAAYIIERLVDRCALDLGIAREELRARNFIRPGQMPYRTPGGRVYDCGEFEQHMRLCMERADWAGFAQRAEGARRRGRVRGIGMSTYIEACAFPGSEAAHIEMLADGSFALKIGTQANGQGHATAYAQMAAAHLGTDYENIELRQGDSDELAKGGGTGGSRSIALGGVSVVEAARIMAEKIRRLAGGFLEASSEDIELAGGAARIAGTDRSVSFAQIAAMAEPEDLRSEAELRQEGATFPNGTHICEVEVDPETGAVEIAAYTIVDDFGVTVNPLLLAGQVHGGVVQGIGQCIHERVVHDEQGQLLTASLLDYALPLAADLPNFDFATRNVPTRNNALGIKGAGEAGTIGACPAVMNAIFHALNSEFGVENIDMPATPEAIWRAIADAGKSQPTANRREL